MTDGARTFDVVVVGAGPAGLASARRAAESGARVAIIDDNPQPGGQIWRAQGARVSTDASRWMPAAVEWIAGAQAIAAPAAGVITIESATGAADLAYRALVLATGARERFLPFPGWTLPNVTGAGGLQALAKAGLPVAGKRVVVAGSGPLLLAVARYLREHGADMRLIAEQAAHPAIAGFAMRLAQHYPVKFAQAVELRAALFGTRYLTSCWPVAANGTEKLESVTLRRRAQRWTEPCDYLACGFGLVPNLELPAMLGCALEGSGVQVDAFQQTSVAGVYAAGEVTGIGGLELSLVEGEIAGYAAAGQSERAQLLFGVRREHRAFAAALEHAFALRRELRHLPSGETLVCRCEDVTYHRIRACAGWREAKLQTRCGMGACQGRVCGAALEFLRGWRNESVRPPVFAARIGSLTGGAAS